MVPFLVLLVLFGATLYWTDPLPIPVAPELMVIHAALLTAVQVQFVPAVTFIVPVPPAAGNDWLVGEME